MKKLQFFAAGIILFLVSICGFKLYMNNVILSNKEAYRDLRTYERFWSSDAQKLIIDENTLPIFGSSELLSLQDYNLEVSSFLNSDEINIMTIGAGNFQSLSHTITLGALSSELNSRKVALFISPQWFAEGGVSPEAFAARMSEDELLEFLHNDDVSKENKQYVLNRTVDLLHNSPTLQSRVLKYRNALENPISIGKIYMCIMRQYWNYRAEYECYKQKDLLSSSLPIWNEEDADFDFLLNLAEEQGRNACTNNEFGIYNEYWDTYVKDTYELGEIKEKAQAYTSSIEYDDLRCFLSVADELGIEVLMVNIPVNGKWYEYQGMLCDEYYANIKTISEEYDNITYIDMSMYENEKYFLKDIMHIGWKGWCRINEELYKKFIRQ